MKKKNLLIMACALLMSLPAFSIDPSNPDLLSQGFDFFDTDTEADGNTLIYTAQYKGGGWDCGGANLLEMGYPEVKVEFESMNIGQVALCVEYEGLPYDYTNPNMQQAVSPLAGEVTVKFLDLPVTKIYVQNGWALNEADMASPENPVRITVLSAELIGNPPLPPAVITASSIKFEDFGLGLRPDGQMHAWGYNTDGDITMIESTETSGNALKYVPNNSDLAVFFNVTLPNGYNVGDIASVEFDTYFDVYGDITEEGDDVEETEILMVFADPTDAIGGGKGFETYPAYFKGNPVPLVGTIGSWVTNTVTIEDFLDADINTGGNSPNFSTLNNLTEVKFAIGLNAWQEGLSRGQVVFYIDNITFLDKNDWIVNVKETSATIESQVYAVDGGIALSANGENVSIFGVDGKLVKQTIANGATISLQKGLYLVKVGSQVEKVIVK